MINKKRLIITSSISIILVSILFLGTTYSIFTTSDIDEDLNVYKTGDLNIEYTSNNVKITDVTPMTEEEADAVIPHRITVTNTGNVPYMFDVILTDTTSSETNTIDYQYIMTKVGYLTPKKLSNCPNNIIKEDIILPAGKSVDIDVRVWLSDNLSNSEIGKSFYSKLSIDGLAIYNDNTEIDNSILSLRYTKNASGSFKFNDIEYKTYIKEASFVDYIDTTNAAIDTTTNEKIIWDMSEKQDNSVVTWLEDNGTYDEDGNKYYNLYISSKEKIYAKTLDGFFDNMSSLENINFDNLNTSLTTNMQSTFRNCISLISLDLSSFNTSNVESMGGNWYGTFLGCTNLVNLNLSSFDTGKVRNMQNLFQGCSSLVELDVSSFDTSSVINMYGMFGDCKSLIELDLSNFDTRNVTDMTGMFRGCLKLVSLDVSRWNTRNVTSMSQMFMYNYELANIDLSGWDMSNVTTLDNMFRECNAIDTTLTIRNSNITNYGYVFTNAARYENAQITVNYTADTATLVDSMIATKSDNSNVVKGQLIA